MIAFSEAPGIASALVVAPAGPWPNALGSVSLEITDSQGQKQPAPLYYVTTNAMTLSASSRHSGRFRKRETNHLDGKCNHRNVYG